MLEVCGIEPMPLTFHQIILSTLPTELSDKVLHTNVFKQYKLLFGHIHLSIVASCLHDGGVWD